MRTSKLTLLLGETALEYAKAYREVRLAMLDEGMPIEEATAAARCAARCALTMTLTDLDKPEWL